LNLEGGVAHYCSVVRPFLCEGVEYFTVGGRGGKRMGYRSHDEGPMWGETVLSNAGQPRTLNFCMKMLHIVALPIAPYYVIVGSIML